MEARPVTLFVDRIHQLSYMDQRPEGNDRRWEIVAVRVHGPIYWGVEGLVRSIRQAVKHRLLPP